MLDYLSGTPRKLDVGFVPSPSGGGMHFWQEEEVRNCYLALVGYAPDLDSATRVETPVLITGVGCLQSVFDYPNEEAFWKDPRGELGHGCYEILGSSWAAHVDEYNRRSFGEPLHVSRTVHHYFVGSKDASCQLLAGDLQVEVFPEMTLQQVVQKSHPRVAAEQRAVTARVSEAVAKNPRQRGLAAKAWAKYNESVREQGGEPPSK
jgi:hypothetical protein